MNANSTPHTSSWISFTYASFILALIMVAVGIVYLPVDLWIKSYLAMGIIMLVQSSITVTKTMRDVHEASRLANRIDDAKTERLLREVSGSNA